MFVVYSCLFVVFSLPFSAEDLAHVQDHYTLLERQIIIEVSNQLIKFMMRLKVSD